MRLWVSTSPAPIKMILLTMCCWKGKKNVVMTALKNRYRGAGNGSFPSERYVLFNAPYRGKVDRPLGLRIKVCEFCHQIIVEEIDRRHLETQPC